MSVAKQTHPERDDDDENTSDDVSQRRVVGDVQPARPDPIAERQVGNKEQDKGGEDAF